MTFEFLSVNEQLAKKIKEKGFNVPCIARFYKKKYRMNFLGNLYDHNSGTINKDYISAPLFIQVKLWIQQKYKTNSMEVIYEGDDKKYWIAVNEYLNLIIDKL